MSEEFHEELLKFSKDVQYAIETVVDKKDALDDHDFDVIQFINELFPSEQSLTNIDEIVSNYEQKLDDVDDQISQNILGQANDSNNDNIKDMSEVLNEIESEIEELFSSIKDVERKAINSEKSVSEITDDIKRMDSAKRNLTQAITTLNHLQMLVNGIENINNLIDSKQYSDVLLPLEGVMQVMCNFERYSTEISEIGDLSRQVQDILSRASVQILADFRDVFESSAKNTVPFNQLADGCRILTLVNDSAKTELIDWFITSQMSEYTYLFRDSEEIAWLDNIDKRYTWFKKHLLKFEENLFDIFPRDWHISERLCTHFCKITEASLGRIMKLRRNDIEVKVLLNCLQRSENFETLLNKRFETTKFSGMIQTCFKPFLYIFINSLDSDLHEIIERSIIAERMNIFGFTDESIEEDDSRFSVAIVLTSSADLFLSYKKGMAQCAQLDNGEPMMKLMEIFRKYFSEYASRVLIANLPKVTPVPNFLQNFSKTLGVGGTTTELGKILSKLEIWKICSILITAEYCTETIQQFQVRFIESVNEKFRDTITFCKEIEEFNQIIGQSIAVMSSELENVCDYNLNSMTKIQWHNLQTVGDQSEYVSAILLVLKTVVPIVRENLSNSRKYFVQFCTKFANSFITKFIQSIYKCKPISTVGAEQLLLDTHMLKTVLTDMPSLGLNEQRKAPSNYSKIVMKGMTTAEMILKIVLAPVDPATVFVQQFVKLLPDAQLSDFLKVLDMKNIKKADQSQLIDLLRTTSTTNVNDQSSDAGDSKIRKLEKILKKHLK